MVTGFLLHNGTKLNDYLVCVEFTERRCVHVQSQCDHTGIQCRKDVGPVRGIDPLRTRKVIEGHVAGAASGVQRQDVAGAGGFGIRRHCGGPAG